MDAFWSCWNSLTPTLREGIVIGVIGGVGATAIAGTLKLFGVSVLAAGKRRFKRQPAPILPASQHELLIRVEPQQPALPPAQAASPASQSESQTPPAPAVAPQIPRSPAVGFVARRDDKGRDILENLKTGLAPERGQFVALCGAGGVGKTTLAAEAARALSAAFAHRVAWVGADGRTDFSLSTLLDEIASQLGHTELEALRSSPLDQKSEQVRALVTEAPTLVVLDNFETIRREEQARCADWFSQCAKCSAIITSRIEPAHAQIINIKVMSPREAKVYLKKLLKEARNPQAFKKLDDDQIINAADRNPLVLQWVIRQIDRAQKPGDVLNELARGEGDAARRVFDRSFDLLDNDGRAALLSLSLFAPSASHAALAEVAGFGADVGRLNRAVGQLSDWWLAGATEGNERLFVEGLTRELSKAHLSENEHADEFRQRFVAYFLNHAEGHAQPTPEDFAALEAEKDNVLGAMDVAFQMKNWDSVMRIRDALEYFLDLRGYWNEAIQRGEQAVAAAQAANDEWAIAQFAGNAAKIRHRRGESDAAKRAYQQAVAAFKKLKSEINIAVGLHNLAVIAQAQGEFDEARRLYDESLVINRKLGDQRGIATTLHELGKLAQAQGELGEARRLYDESLKIRRKLSDQSGIAQTLHQLGMVAEDEGDEEEAARLFREALIIFEKLKSPNAEIARENLKRVEGESS